MALAAGTAVAASAVAPPSGSRDVLRTAVAQPFDPHDYVSPLSGFRMYEQATLAPQTMFTVSGLPDGARIRIATLDSYNGIVYSVGSDGQDSASGSFTRVPSAFDQSAVAGQRLAVDVTIGAYQGVWLPTVGKFERIEFVGSRRDGLRDSFYYNDNSGTAAVVEPLREGDHYRLQAVLPVQPSAEQLSGLTPGSEESPRPALVPDELSNALDGYVRDIASPGDRLAAMIDGLKRNGYVSHGVSEAEPPSRSGHAADRITQLLTDQRMIGDQEQYAVTAALMARELGFPARVVFGFVPQLTDDASPKPVAVHGSDISAWIEVGTAQFGWVALDPTPPVREIPPETPQAPAQVARPQSPVQPPPQEKDTHSIQTPPERTQEETPAPDPLLQALLVALHVAGWLALGSARRAGAVRDHHRGEGPPACAPTEGIHPDRAHQRRLARVRGCGGRPRLRPTTVADTHRGGRSHRRHALPVAGLGGGSRGLRARGKPGARRRPGVAHRARAARRTRAGPHQVAADQGADLGAIARWL